MPQIFQEKYWELLYHKPQEMDGVGNAKDHVDYLQALFNLEGIKIKSLVDVGFGPGVLLKKIHQRFKPKFSLGLEPSPVMFNKFHHPKIKKNTHRPFTVA